jgi:hypothetical protein
MATEVPPGNIPTHGHLYPGPLDLVVGKTQAFSLELRLRNKALVQMGVWNSNEDLGRLNAVGLVGAVEELVSEISLLQISWAAIYLQAKVAKRKEFWC